MKTLGKTQNTGTAAAPGRCARCRRGARRFFWILGALGRRAAGRTGGPVRSPCGAHGGRPTHATAEDHKNTQSIHKKPDIHKNFWKTPKTIKHTRRTKKKNHGKGKKLPRQTKKQKNKSSKHKKTKNIKPQRHTKKKHRNQLKKHGRTTHTHTKTTKTQKKQVRKRQKNTKISWKH